MFYLFCKNDLKIVKEGYFTRIRYCTWVFCFCSILSQKPIESGSRMKLKIQDESLEYCWKYFKFHFFGNSFLKGVEMFWKSFWADCGSLTLQKNQYFLCNVKVPKEVQNDHYFAFNFGTCTLQKKILFNTNSSRLQYKKTFFFQFLSTCSYKLSSTFQLRLVDITKKILNFLLCQCAKIIAKWLCCSNFRKTFVAESKILIKFQKQCVV